jgi:hypothetical protein
MALIIAEAINNKNNIPTIFGCKITLVRAAHKPVCSGPAIVNTFPNTLKIANKNISITTTTTV